MYAMENKASHSHPTASYWTNRILIVSVMGIIFLTLYPFRFDFGGRLLGNSFPLLLGPPSKTAGARDVFLNILLFVPFGFGLATRFRQHNRSWGATFVLALAGGALCSYTIEFLQFYIPERNAGWEDVLTNSTGSIVGFFVFALYGKTILQRLAKWEQTLEDWLSLPRTAAILLAYVGLCLAISIPLQQKTALSNWDTDSVLMVGATRYPWKGQVFLLQLWDRAVPEKLALRLTNGEPMGNGDIGFLGSYEFSGAGPVQDQKNFLPPLFSRTEAPAPNDSKIGDLESSSWFASRLPMTNLLRQLKKTNQFAIRITCAPAQTIGVDQRIISIVRPYGVTNMFLQQEEANLVFWFRNPLSVTRSFLAWQVPNIFAARQTRDILISYDGSNASLYVDGNRMHRPYRLGPGASLAHMFLRLKAAELDGYIVVYDSMIFVPAGFLVGLAARKMKAQTIDAWLLLGLGVFVPSVLLEFLLVSVSGRAISIAQVGLSVFLTIAGSLLTLGYRPEISR